MAPKFTPMQDENGKWDIHMQDDCPNCGKSWTFDGSENFVQSSENDHVDFIAHCDKCGNNWNITIGIRISF
jgi:hypothetical protein